MKRRSHQHWHIPPVQLKPEAFVLTSFGTAIVAGTLLLLLPISHRADIGFSDALFTATSAVCVTGLIVVDTGRDFTLFGQCVILVLIELGGLGVMTFAALAFDLLGKRLSLSGQEAMTKELVHDEMSHGFRTHFRRMLRLVLAIEAVGAVLLSAALVPDKGVLPGIYSAIFHSVSAFCNAGFSLYSDSLRGFSENPLMVGTVAALIVVGGIGYPVLFDFLGGSRLPANKTNPLSPPRLSLHTKVVLITTLMLLVGGSVLFLLSGLPVQGVDFGAAIFQAITARTAGFNTVPIGQLPLATLLVLMALMFIGGSPGSCAGGVKTVTAVLWIGKLQSRLQGKTSVILMGRCIPEPLVQRSSAIISLAIIWNIIGAFVLSITENGLTRFGLHDILFEQLSAFGTVGLSTGVTGELSGAGRLWVIATMFVGRTGPLSGVLLLLRRRSVGVRYPTGKVMIG